MKIKQFTIPTAFILVVIAAMSLSVLQALYSQSIRLDESQSIWVATKPLGSLLQNVSKDVHVPLYLVLLHFWLQVGGTSIVWSRLLSTLFFVLTLPPLYSLATKLTSRRAALVAVALFSFSPFIMWFTAETRMYTLFTLLVTLNHLAFVNMIRTSARTGKIWYGITFLLGIYTHYFFFLLTATQLFYLWVRNLSRNGVTWEHVLKIWQNRTLIKVISTLAVSILFFAPWVWYASREGAGSSTSPLLESPSSYNVVETYTEFLFGFQKDALENLLISMWPLSIIMLFGLFTRRKWQNLNYSGYIFLATVFPTLLVFLVSMIKPIFLARYLILVTPTLFIFLAWLLTNYVRNKLAITSIGLTAVLLLFMSQQVMSSSTPVKEDYRETVGYLNEEVRPFDIVAVSAPFTVYPVEYYYLGKAKLVTIPEWSRFTNDEIPAFDEEVFEKQIAGMTGRYDRVFLVLSYDQGYEKDIQKYMDNHFELLYRDEYSPNLQIRVYKIRY